MSEEMSIDTGAEPVESVQPEGFQTEEPNDQPEGSISVEANPSGSEAVQENLETLKDQIQEAKDNGASKQEIKELIKEFELKVNGKTVKTKINLSDEEAVKRELQKAYAFNDVSQENASIKKALSAKIAAWKSDPSLLFADLGVDATEFSVNHLDRQIEESKKTPEQKAKEQKEKEYEEAMNELKAYKEREQKLKQMLEDRKKEEEQANEIQQLTQEIDSAISKSKILQADGETRSRLADLMYHYSNKFPDREITAEMVLPILEKQIVSESKKVYGKMTEEELESHIGEEQLKKLIARHLQKAAQPKVEEKVKPVIPSQAAPQQAPKKKEEVVKKVRSFEDVMRQR